jgi:hypothetical protein
MIRPVTPCIGIFECRECVQKQAAINLKQQKIRQDVIAMGKRREKEKLNFRKKNTKTKKNYTFAFRKKPVACYAK